MLKKMFTGRKRVPFMQENLRGDSELEQDDGGRETESSEPIRKDKSYVEFDPKKPLRVSGWSDGSEWTISRSPRSQWDSSYRITDLTFEHLRYLKKILNSMEELN